MVNRNYTRYSIEKTLNEMERIINYPPNYVFSEEYKNEVKKEYADLKVFFIKNFVKRMNDKNLYEYVNRAISK